MSDIPIKNIAGSIGIDDIAGIKPLSKENGSGFDKVINEAINKVSQVQNDAEKAVNEMASGGDVTSAILAIEKADMSFRMMVEVRNKLMRSYEEIMRMQV